MLKFICYEYQFIIIIPTPFWRAGMESSHPVEVSTLKWDVYSISPTSHLEFRAWNVGQNNIKLKLATFQNVTVQIQ